jgi:LysR family hydrogen peroxide-inducible transcriptional activator
MNITALSLRDLEYLAAVAEHTHFGKAAEACHITQPALSAQIRKIEDLLGAEIFERTKRSVSVTANGALIVAQAKVVLEEAAKIINLVEHNRQPLTGPFRLGVIATLGPYLMPHLLAPLKKKFPKLELSLEEGLTKDLLQQLKSGNLDAVLASPTFSEASLKTYQLFFEPFLLAVPKDHALSSKSSVSSTDLKPEDMVLLEDGHCLADQAMDVCPRRSRGNFRRFHVTSLETLKHIVASGLGYTLIPALAAKSDANMKSLFAYRHITGRHIGRNIVLVCRKSSARVGDIETLVEFIRLHLPQDLTLK